MLNGGPQRHAFFHSARSGYLHELPRERVASSRNADGDAVKHHEQEPYDGAHAYRGARVIPVHHGVYVRVAFAEISKRKCLVFS